MDGLCGRDPRCNLFQPNGGPCQQCNQGYSLSSTGLCQRINCDQLTPDGKCINVLLDLLYHLTGSAYHRSA